MHLNEKLGDKKTKDTIEIVGQKEVGYKKVHTGSFKLRRGHKIFEVDLVNHTIEAIEPKKEAIAPFIPKKKSKTTGIGIISSKGGKVVTLKKPELIRYTIDRKPNHIYIGALNKKNVYKKLIKAGIIRIINADPQENTETIV